MRTTKGMRIATVWRLCIEMWEWIVERIEAGDERDIEKLKEAWLKEHGYKLYLDCFFCDYMKRNRDGSCSPCPAVTIDPDFDCMSIVYDYYENPVKFLAKLHRMHKKFLKMQKEKR